MVLKVVATPCLKFSNPNLPQSPSSSLSSAISSPSLPRRCRSDVTFVLKSLIPTLNRSALFGSHATREFWKPKSRTSTRACLNEFSDEEFFKNIQDLSPGFHLSDDVDQTKRGFNTGSWDPETECLKLQWRQEFWDCSMKKAFSSMVFIIRELHCYTFQMREVLFFENLQGILDRVENEVQASFVWLFQQVFSRTPTLMILLANYSVHSMGNKAALAAVNPSSHKHPTLDKTEKMQALFSDETRRELLYRIGLSQEPNNPLLLANYAQFLYLTVHDYDRAEELFKKAIQVEPADAEAYSKYANFVWKARDDLWAAEEIFLEAIEADPHNPYYSANYADFLWTTGGEDTCYPLAS
ncbi:hypothetical protein like AT2G29670 [Hibiscus trionum]|uniref:Uncharacterized protein n=1 Tax=Hibiscus trionum TaxID=183268 RepID=A0A9W7LR85_HIBTR|nr:hypothetical protein like AT2G29670 [Hibiscus trionum]